MHAITDKENQLLSRIRAGDEKALDEIYNSGKVRFVRFAKKMLKDESALEDIYQDTVIAFYENVRTGKIVSLKSSINTYLIGIGKYMLYHHLKTKKSMTELDQADEWALGQVTNAYIEQLEDQESGKRWQRAIEMLGEPCSSLLRLFYYEDKEHTEIAAILGYANADVIKSQKYRCMQTLKKIIKR